MKKLSLAELERLFNAEVDGLLDNAERSALEDVLRSDAEARRQYVRFMELHALLHWDHGAEVALLTAPEKSPPLAASAVHRIRSWRISLLALATVAAGMLLILNTVLRFSAPAAPGKSLTTIAQVELIQGVVLFRDGAEERLLAPGGQESLSAGVILLEGDTSAAQCRFLDGTLVTFTSDTEAHLNDAGQKRLRLLRGMLTAEVRPQPVGRPMVIETPTARVEVLGTVFTLAAEPERTRVRVNSGTVRLQRLVDGQAVDVPQAQSCEASLNANDELRPRLPEEPKPGWCHEFTSPPPAAWKGEWLAPEPGVPGRMRAAPCIVGRKARDEATPIVHFGMTARKLDEVSLGLLPSDGALEITYRSQQPTPLQVMIGVHQLSGAFGGNFEAKLARPTDAVPLGQWRRVEIPFAEFRPLIERYKELKENDRPFLILITTYGRDAGLEVSEMRISGKEDRSE
jgi:ferric-dicitrate binding protein FerR (iron transport regulator)